MEKLLKSLMIILAIGIVSCSSDLTLENHPLIGNYLGNWDSNPSIESKFSIEYEGERDKIVLFFTLADSLDLNILSDTEFSIDRYEQNGYSNMFSGVLVGDSMFIQNEVFLAGESNLEALRTGVFVKQ